jgi:DNA polymerase III subunit delta'
MSETNSTPRAELRFWQQSTWQSFARRRAGGRLPHALLIGSQPGLGGAAFARILAASLMCYEPKPDFHACGRCRGCMTYANASHPDFREITALEKRVSIGIDQIRALSLDMSMTPQAGPIQVSLIAHAEQMTVAAANALLKTLEEPSPNTVLLLQTEQPGKLIPTILSRCQRLNLMVPARAEALTWLNENSSGAASLRESALDLALGAPELALAMIDDGRVGHFVSLGQDLAALPKSADKIRQQWSDKIVEFVSLTSVWLRTQSLHAAQSGARARLLHLSTHHHSLQKLQSWQGTGVRLDLALAEWLAHFARAPQNVG